MALTGSFFSNSTEISDSTANNNDATLYSGRYASSDGVDDKLINADCSALGSGNYALTGWARSSTTGTKYAKIGGTAVTFTISAADTWEQVTTTTASSVTPSDVSLGWDGSSNFSACDFSDWQLTGGSATPRWQLNESADASIDGYPALDSSGNGYHGTHDGGAGETGEGIDPDFVGAVYEANESQLWFTGSGVTVPSCIPFNFATAFTLEWEMLLDNSTGVAYIFASNHASGALFGSFYTHSVNNKINLFLGGTNDLVNACSWSTVPRGTGLRTYKFEWDGVDTATLTVDGVNLGSRTLSAPALVASTWDLQGITVGFYKDIKYDGVLLADGAGTDASNWNGVTPTGNPITVGQKRATILQTAGMDWNKYTWFDGTDDTIATTEPFQDIGKLEITFLFLNNDSVVLFAESTADKGISITQARTPGNIHVTIEVSAGSYVSVSKSGFNAGEIVTVIAEWNIGTSSLVATFNGEASDGSLIGRKASEANVPFLVGNNGISASNYYKGIVYDFTVYDTDKTTPIANFTGIGNNPWDDTIGSNDGTINGSPSNYLIPVSDTGSTVDALGNAIANPRPTSDTLNLFGDGEYAEAADADSLDLTTEATWELWGNFYALSTDPTEVFFSKFELSAGRSWALFHFNGAGDGQFGLQFSSSGTSSPTNYRGDITLSDAIQHVVYTYNGTTVKAYVNGSEVTVTNGGGGAIPPSLFVSTSEVLIGAWDPDAPTAFSDIQISRSKIYNRALTADEVLQNYNAQKGKFGL